MYKTSIETLQLIADVSYLRAKLGKQHLNISEIINIINCDDNEYDIRKNRS